MINETPDFPIEGMTPVPTGAIIERGVWVGYFVPSGEMKMRLLREDFMPVRGRTVYAKPEDFTVPDPEPEPEPPVLPDTWIDGDVIRHCDRNQGTWVRTGRKWHNCERNDLGSVLDDDWATLVIVNGYGKVLHANRETAVASLPPVPVWSVSDEDAIERAARGDAE